MAVMAEVGEAAADIPGVEGPWSCLDILGHVEFWDGRAMENLELVAEGRAGEILRPDSDAEVDVINARAAEERRGMTLGQLQAQWAQTALRLDARLLAVTREELESDIHGRTMAELVAVDTYDHYAKHRESIQVWLTTRLGEPTRG
jgi:hypothetical protein